MVAFSRITIAFAIAGLSSAQSSHTTSSASRTSVVEVARATDGPSGVFRTVAHTTGAPYPSNLSPTATGSDAFRLRRAQQTGDLSLSDDETFAFPSGVAKPSGTPGRKGKGRKGGKGGKGCKKDKKKGSKAGNKNGGDKNGGDKNGGDKNGGDKDGGDKNGGDKSSKKSATAPAATQTAAPGLERRQQPSAEAEVELYQESFVQGRAATDSEVLKATPVLERRQQPSAEAEIQPGSPYVSQPGAATTTSVYERRQQPSAEAEVELYQESFVQGRAAANSEVLKATPVLDRRQQPSGTDTAVTSSAPTETGVTAPPSNKSSTTTTQPKQTGFVTSTVRGA